MVDLDNGNHRRIRKSVTIATHSARPNEGESTDHVHLHIANAVPQCPPREYTGNALSDHRQFLKVSLTRYSAAISEIVSATSVFVLAEESVCKFNEKMLDCNQEIPLSRRVKGHLHRRYYHMGCDTAMTTVGIG